MKVQAAGLVVFMCHGEAGVTLDAGKYVLYYISLIRLICKLIVEAEIIVMWYTASNVLPLTRESRGCYFPCCSPHTFLSN